MTPRTKEQNEEIRLRRLAQIRKAAADVFLTKGPLLEIREVAQQAGLGYGTVYHYYTNKGDLLHDLLWDALERASGWLGGSVEAPEDNRLEAMLKVPLEARTPASGEAPGGRHLSLAEADTGSYAATGSRSRSREGAAPEELGPIAAAGVRLLRLWAEDHALYLLYKHAGEEFAALPDARSAALSAAFRRDVLVPLAALLESGREADGASTSGGIAEPPYRLQRAEMLLAALVGCASLSLRRGKLGEEAGDIVRFLNVQNGWGGNETG
ncbi:MULTISPECIES: TetR/AcrR family transcriptional regulator [unclassified Paenibacillus]|uniref:TetR/AcrR family transcriptional regulator n=1 Tax=unclassified Paenibacillus TaxID=185978 RepID=UPI00095506A4|nr:MULTISPECIES: TetR/AcrR family transcriptional regulator [unclassified Paenibacillus]ASS65375.1 TetR/AcrR family transcriptional regulator [Paenibacillus sp. RUD330]SIQ38316.1 transcriptional regulator, TetR family [Paenibacillus sp. RU4X]SIQ60497.1 transcriptional regulator, TetR family [Paenibacillus sp. RU4T]